ncbi:uncharacterized protein LOC110226299 [Arabidopsis lyrata subsp. lyrata]|uniref:uncharacterized protein LOC110226299 n=1 Tax=Arabidopsis lyrata subsp. lyrata TaxID=81972 RepID=UPI000A29D152|nr:uncharacterized protein LOC110226299 [Arabidopsis lyrata subsp. lyrata]|eukprot:XP_020873020.1 uncharacterized protein LOC110226299 [Arabidopsis lyrata subsp. lyrata]
MTRSSQVHSLHNHLNTISLPLRPLVEDVYGWYVNDVDCNSFSSSKTWQVIRQREEKKGWAAAIWFKGSIPRNAFNMWTTHLDRLPTRARLQAWGLPVSPLCCLCSAETETRDHLMLRCDFSTAIWNLVQSRLRLHSLRFLDWAELLSWIRRTSPTAPSTLRKLITQAVVYATWKQRNNMLHNSNHIAPAAAFMIIDREVINSINARRHRRKFRNLMSLWLI